MILDWALCFLVGCGAALQPHFLLLFPLLVIGAMSKRKGQCFLFFALGILLALYHKPTLNDEHHEGKGIFVLSSIAPTQSPFSRTYTLRGKLKSFEVEGQLHHSIPCVLFQKKIPEKGNEFYVEGVFEKGVFKLSKRPLQVIQAGFSLPHFRFRAKEKIRVFFHELSDRKVGHFFASMTTGDIDDLLLSMEFRKCGLSHILAISGFHFALLALVCGTLLRLIFPRKASDLLLIALLTLAFLYLGPTPSIMRAYLMICLYLIGQFLGRIPDSLNLLGFALFLELMINPLSATQVGFQLSFFATFGILTLYRPFEKKLRFLLPIRRIENLKGFSLIDKHGYLLSSILRKGLALNGAVHLVTLPILLFHFHNFPLMSIPFNLFMPPLLGLSILGMPLGPLNIAYTRFLLDVLSYAPECLNFQLFASNFPYELAICLCTLFGTLGLTLSRRIGQNDELFVWRS